MIWLYLDILQNTDWLLLTDGRSRKHLKTERISQRYTTDWKELVVVIKLEIAELTGKRHANVLRDTRKILDEVEINQLKFESVYLAGTGEERIYFNLPRMECDLVVSEYSAKYRLAIIKSIAGV